MHLLCHFNTYRVFCMISTVARLSAYWSQITQGGEWGPTVLDHMLTDDDDWVSKVKREDDQEYDSPFDKRGGDKHKESVRAGIQVDNPTGPPSIDPDNIEVNFHAADAARQVHQAYQEASNLNEIYVYEGKGMSDDEIETVEEEDELRKTLRQTLLLWRPSQNPLTTPSIEGNFYTCQSRRSGRHSLLRPKMQLRLYVGPRQTRLSSHQTLHSTCAEERKQ